jgi:2-polyprenyl-6-methoxyphenol hydroxylase-like FAD-dependent oxidoreductase
VLAYAIGPDRARVLFNRPLPRSSPPRLDADPPIEALPPGLRSEVRLAMAAGTARHFVSSDVTVRGVTMGRVVLVGDAAGTCHPISASGMTMGIDDAIRLSRALRRRDGDVAAALPLYAIERRSRQRARVLLAAMLHDVLGGSGVPGGGGTDLGMLRAGLYRYWTGSARARAASMALLGMTDVRMRSILLEFARVVACGFVEALGEPLGLPRRAGLMARLSRPVMRHLVGAMRVQ